MGGLLRYYTQMRQHYFFTLLPREPLYLHHTAQKVLFYNTPADCPSHIASYTSLLVSLYTSSLSVLE
jgi:hypothetical protein